MAYGMRLLWVTALLGMVSSMVVAETPCTHPEIA